MVFPSRRRANRILLLALRLRLSTAMEDPVLHNHDHAVRALPQQATKPEQIGKFDLALLLKVVRILLSQIIEIFGESYLHFGHFALILNGAVAEQIVLHSVILVLPFQETQWALLRNRCVHVKRLVEVRQ